MKKISGLLFLGATLCSGAVAAQTVGKVISSTPVVSQVSEPRNICVTPKGGQQTCYTETTTESRTVGYKVVYEYAGRRHETQLAHAPGQTIELEVSHSIPGATRIAHSQPVYSAPAPAPVIVERVVREPVYVERRNVPAPVYYADYYNPVVPLLGLALGYTAGYYSRGWVRDWRPGHSHGHRGPWHWR